MPRPAELAYLPSRVVAVLPIGEDSLVECTDPIDPAAAPIRVAAGGVPAVGDRVEVAWVDPDRRFPEGRWAIRRGGSRP